MNIPDIAVGILTRQLNVITEALNPARPGGVNVQKARNHVALIQANVLPMITADQSPDDEIVLFTFQINAAWRPTPYQGNEKIPITINALSGWWTMQDRFTGINVLSAVDGGQLLELYDSADARLPSLQTTTFHGGVWSGFAVVRSVSRQAQDIGLHALDPASGVGGNTSTPIRWTP